MAGDLPGFDADGFREAIRFAMTLGAAPDTEQRATFIFARTQTTTAQVDASGVPYAPTASVTRAPAKKVQVPCGIEEVEGTSVMTSVGTRAASRIVVTLLDEDFAQVAGFERVAVSGMSYRYGRELIQRGLGPVGIHRIECQLEDAR